VARKSIQNISLGRLEKLEVNIEGVKMKDDFEVMEIMDDSNPYHVLLGIDWAFENNAMLNLKNQHISFETDTQCVIAPLYPNEGDWYNESVDEDAQRLVIKNIYKIIGNHKYYVNPMMDGELSWRSVKSYEIDSDDTLERWQKKLYEISKRRCTCITTEVHEKEFGSY
jgi:hypothetical protein